VTPLYLTSVLNPVTMAAIFPVLLDCRGNRGGDDRR
jgi:hypothetical protein